MACPSFPIRPRQVRSTRRLPCHRTLVLGCTSNPRPPSNHVISLVKSWEYPKIYLLDLALPSFLPLVRPFICERCFSRFNHPRARRVFLAQVTVLLLNRRNNSPATVRRVFQMFCQRIIILLPSIQSSVTEKTDNIVGVRWLWKVEETCFSELWACQKEMVED